MSRVGLNVFGKILLQSDVNFNAVTEMYRMLTRLCVEKCSNPAPQETYIKIREGLCLDRWVCLSAQQLFLKYVEIILTLQMRCQILCDE